MVDATHTRQCRCRPIDDRNSSSPSVDTADRHCAGDHGSAAAVGNIATQLLRPRAAFDKRARAAYAGVVPQGSV